MPTKGETLSALLASGRIANLPTVWSNVLVAFWLSSSLTPLHQSSDYDDGTRLLALLITILAASMIYVGGCLLGDAVDAEFDQKHRPQRPIPSGILSAVYVKLVALLLLAIALIGWFFGHQLWAQEIQPHLMILVCLLIALVSFYAFYHKKNKPAALLMMASCRFMLIMLAIGAAHQVLPAEHSVKTAPLTHYFDWVQAWMILLASSVGLYTLLLSWVASTESSPGAFKSRSILAALLLSVPLITIPCRPMLSATTYTGHVVALLIIYLWLCYALVTLKRSKPGFVSRALAGFCLLDACFLALLDPVLAMIPLLLFVLALAMQRYTPAT